MADLLSDGLGYQDNGFKGQCIDCGLDIYSQKFDTVNEQCESCQNIEKVYTVFVSFHARDIKDAEEFVLSMQPSDWLDHLEAEEYYIRKVER